MTEVLLYDALRSPRTKGRPGGALSPLPPHQLVARLIDELRRRHGERTIAAVEGFVLSCVGQVGAQGGNLALVSKLEAGLHPAATTQTINNFCVGGITAIANAAASVRAGDTDLVLAGGVEMMSHVPFLGDEASYYTDPAVAEKLQFAPVGIAADLLAHRHGIDRDELDSQTLESHRRAAAAWAGGRYDAQVAPIEVKGTTISTDETIRADLTADYLATLPPVFEQVGVERYDEVVCAARPGLGKIRHQHSRAHCPPIADGAALVVVGSPEAGTRLGLDPIARIVHITESGGDHVDQLTAGEAAMERLLDRHALGLGDMGLIEYMEAFAVVPALFHRTHDVDPDLVNPNGGHLAMGHPMGATGAILVTALAHGMADRDVDRGLAVAHGGSGVGAAVLLEAV